MTEQPNIKMEILDYVIKNTSESNTVNLRRFAKEKYYSEKRVAKHSDSLYDAIECGVSSMLPWPCNKQTALEYYDKWDSEPPEKIDDINWTFDESGNLY